MGSNGQVRIFFALWPDDRLRQRLEDVAALLAVERPARRVPGYNLHLTLHFVGNVDRDRMECLRRAARAVQGETFELVLDIQGYFPRPRVAWFGCSEVPAAVAALHRELGEQLYPCGFRAERRRFQPHVTVARKLAAAPPPALFAPLAWRVEEFTLIESRPVDNGVKYHVAETYPLR